MSNLPNLFSPFRIGTLDVRNRIVSTAHQTLFGEDHLPKERLIAYHVERAKGGVGLIILETVSVHPSYVGYKGEQHLYLHNDEAVPWFRKLADAIHEYGAKVMVELSHGGAIGKSSPDFPLIAPSAISREAVHEMAKEMEIAEIQQVVQAFGRAARRAKEAHIDGVDLHGAHGNLITQFMSPYSNERTDEYGGRLENRLRFPLEVIDSVRHSVGSDFPVGMRISGDEFIDGGLTLEDMVEIAPALASRLDFLDVSFANYSEYMGYALNMPPMYIPLGSFVYLASAIKKVVDIPVIAVGRINDPVQAEQILADGHADLVGMTRALICDPELPNKARENRVEDIRVCVACCEGCASHIVDEAEPMACIQNPVTGREREWASIEPARSKKKVIVAGGGPAGMEAAWAAARRGHQVVLYEKLEQLGGQVLIAAKAPMREEFGDIVRNLSRQLKREKVTIKLGVEASADMILAEAPDVVIIATGSTPYVPSIPGANGANVVTDWDILQEKIDAGRKVIVLDGEAHQRACSTAEFLADRGKHVEVVTRAHYVGMNLNSMDKPLVLQRLLQKKVVSRPHTWVKEIRGNEVVVFDTLTREENVIPNVDVVVLAIGGQADNRLYEELKGRVKKVCLVGDCLSPRKVENAIYEGFKTGISI
jgi:mycofactocin system FadH/OYE family oxidoreductase 2